MLWSPSRADIHRFTYGDCHVLARAVARLTGLACASFAWNEQVDFHAFNVLPDGRCLDINGLSSEADFRKKWGAPTLDILIHPSPRACALSGWGQPVFGHYSYARARVVAKRLAGNYLDYPAVS